MPDIPGIEEASARAAFAYARFEFKGELPDKFHTWDGLARDRKEGMAIALRASIPTILAAAEDRFRGREDGHATPFLEANALLAIQNDDYAGALDSLRQLSRSELRALARAASNLANQATIERVRQEGAIGAA